MPNGCCFSITAKKHRKINSISIDSKCSYLEGKGLFCSMKTENELRLITSTLHHNNGSSSLDDTKNLTEIVKAYLQRIGFDKDGNENNQNYMTSTILPLRDDEESNDRQQAQQWFVVVPGCLNLVQGPVNYQNFLKMGVESKNIQLAGHWIPRDLVMNIPSDCERRIQRAKSGVGEDNGNFKPRRILIPVGGAGAQRKFIVQFVKALEPLIQAGKVQLFLNAGDHKHMKAAFKSVLSEIGLDGEYETVDSTAGVHAFRDNLLKGNEPRTQVTLFSFDDYFPAVATTDILSRVSDVLACKPSELAFYPVPKLMIRRVGDHEQYSALRAAELGDGTLEAREIEDCLTYMHIFVGGSQLLEQMNNSIVKNNTEGIYDGCENAVRIALERSATLKKDGSF